MTRVSYVCPGGYVDVLEFTSITPKVLRNHMSRDELAVWKQGSRWCVATSDDFRLDMGDWCVTPSFVTLDKDAAMMFAQLSVT